MREWTESEIYEKIRTIVSEALEVDSNAIKPDSMLIKELGAESIDILDIVFRLEKSFDLTIPEQSLRFDPKSIPDGKRPDEYFTVQVIVDFVISRLAKEQLVDRSSSDV